MPEFVHLNVHSEYSALEGIASLESLCKGARERGFKALALTDSDGLYGAVRFLEIARQHGLKGIIGAEVSDGFGRAVLLARDGQGYANLCRIVSARHEQPGFSLCDAVAVRRDGLIVISDHGANLTAWKRDSREDLYVEITPGPNVHASAELSRREKLPAVATNRVHFVDAADYALYPMLQAIRLNTKLCRVAAPARVLRRHWLMPAELFNAQLAGFPEAIANSANIAGQCDADLNIRKSLWASCTGDPENFARLREKTYTGARRRYGEITPAVCERIERELQIIETKNLAEYFLVVAEITANLPITCGRGSGAASIVSYCLGITNVDPVEHNLFFERFLTAERDDPPDIDIDIPWDEREQLLRGIFSRYGKERVAMVANHNRLGWAGALREAAKVYGIAPDEITRISGRLSKHREVFELSENPRARAWAESLCRRIRLASPWPEILHKAMHIEGRFRNVSLHCGGAVIVPREIRARVPVQTAANGMAMLQWDKEQVEEAGLIKIDLLGNRSLAVIRDTLASIRRDKHKAIEYSGWDPRGDAQTEAMIRNGETIGCFNIESPAVRLLLKKLWLQMPPERKVEADLFKYLVMVSSLVRPAAISFVAEFIRRAHSGCTDAVHPSVQETLRESHGLMLYQEDVSRVAIAFAGFTARQADQLRQALNKKREAKDLEQFRDEFFRGARARGIALPIVEGLWRMALSFAGYSFCKAHAASYAQISLRCAYLKAHFPAEFMAAVLSHEGGYYPTFAYISEARRMGLELKPPDINQSEWHYHARDGAIRMGFMHIRGIQKTFIERVLIQRSAEGPYRSFAEFWKRAEPELGQCRLLIKAGCFDGIGGGLSRPGMLWRAYALQHGGGYGGLPNPQQYSDEQKLGHEIESFGFVASCHPLALYGEPREHKFVRAAEMARHAGKRIRVLGWLVTEKLTQTRKGDAMEFVTFEDASAIYEATFFPDTYRRVWNKLVPNRPFVLSGIVEEDFGVVTLNVKDIARLDVAEKRCYGEPHGGKSCEEAEALGSGFPAAGTHARGFA